MSDDDDACPYEPEYEVETFTIPSLHFDHAADATPVSLFPRPRGPPRGPQLDDNDNNKLIEKKKKRSDSLSLSSCYCCELQVLTVLPPPLEYMSSLHSQKQEISGRKVWTGSLVLCHYLLNQQIELLGEAGDDNNNDDTNVMMTTMATREEERNTDEAVSSIITTKITTTVSLFRQKRILELGSGTGLVGMVVSKSMDPPLCVALTDGDFEAVELMEKNLGNSFNEIDKSVVKVHPLLWGYYNNKEDDDNSNDSATDFDRWCRESWPDLWSPTAISNDENGRSDEKDVMFDYIVAGDVLYKEELPPLFFSTVNRYLSKTNGTALFLCHAPRANVTQDIVVNAAIQAGFYVKKQTVDLTNLSEQCPRDEAERAVVYKITREEK